MTALAPTLPPPPPSLSDCAISAPLWRLLDSPVPGEVEVAEIVRDEALRRECCTIAAPLAALAAPCGDAFVKRALQPLVLVFGVGEAARSAAYWTVYVRSLSDLPAEALARAVEDYARAQDSRFFPKPGPLRALAEVHALPIRRAAQRARKVAAANPEPRAPEPLETRRRTADAIRAAFNISKGTAP